MNDPVQDPVRRYWQGLADGDLEASVATLADDFVEEWPQSGERLRGREAWRRVVLEHPALPSMSLRRARGAGDLWVCEADFLYPGSDEPWRVCSIMELRGGLISRITQYFGAPFEAAPWRADFVERFDASR